MIVGRSDREAGVAFSSTFERPDPKPLHVMPVFGSVYSAPSRQRTQPETGYVLKLKLHFRMSRSDLFGPGYTELASTASESRSSGPLTPGFTLRSFIGAFVRYGS